MNRNPAHEKKINEPSNPTKISQLISNIEYGNNRTDSSDFVQTASWVSKQLFPKCSNFTIDMSPWNLYFYLDAI